MGFGCKAHGKQRVAFRSHGGKDVWVAHQLQHQLLIRLPNFFLRREFGTVISHGRRGDKNVCGAHLAQHHLVHLLRAAHVDTRHAIRRCQGDWPADQRNLSTCVVCGTRHREPHLARTTVADEAHRVDGFLGRARSDQHPASAQRARFKQFGERRHQGVGFQHTPGASFATGLIADGGAKYFYAAL